MPILTVMTITDAQCRAARGLLNMTRTQLAKRSGVSARAIANFESGKTTPIKANLAILRQTFELFGVEFFAHDGVRLKSG